MKNLASPEQSRNLKWQRILVGQEPIDGAALVGLPNSSMWKRLGFQSGDVIVRINGRDLHSSKDLDKALSVLGKEQNSNIDFKVIRGQQQMILNYQLSW